MDQARDERPLHRRIGRRVLGVFRPLAAPFLHRLEWRVARGVERSALMNDVADIRARMDGVGDGLRQEFGRSQGESQGEEQLRAAVAQTGEELRAAITRSGEEVQARLRQECGRIVTAQAELATDLAIRLDALSLAQLRGNAFEARMAALGEELAALRAALAAPSSHALPSAVDILVPTPCGPLLMPADEAPLARALIEDAGLLEPGTLAVLRTLVPDDGCMVEVGANIGIHAVPMARALAESGRVLALVPSARAARTLRGTLALNGLAGTVHVAEMGDGTPDLPSRRVDVVKLNIGATDARPYEAVAGIVAAHPRAAVVVAFGASCPRPASEAARGWMETRLRSGFAVWRVSEADGALRPLGDADLDHVAAGNLLLLREPVTSYAGLRLAA